MKLFFFLLAPKTGGDLFSLKILSLATKSRHTISLPPFLCCCCCCCCCCCGVYVAMETERFMQTISQQILPSGILSGNLDRISFFSFLKNENKIKMTFYLFILLNLNLNNGGRLSLCNGLPAFFFSQMNLLFIRCLFTVAFCQTNLSLVNNEEGCCSKIVRKFILELNLFVSLIRSSMGASLS